MMNSGSRRASAGSIVAWLALVIALGAVGVSLLAYSRANVDLTAQFEAKYPGALSRVRLQLAKLEAASDLIKLRDTAAFEINLPPAQGKVREIQADLRDAFREADAETSAEWQGLQTNFQGLLQLTFSESSRAKILLDELIAQLGGSSGKKP